MHRLRPASQQTRWRRGSISCCTQFNRTRSGCHVAPQPNPHTIPKPHEGDLVMSRHYCVIMRLQIQPRCGVCSRRVAQIPRRLQTVVREGLEVRGKACGPGQIRQLDNNVNNTNAALGFPDTGCRQAHPTLPERSCMRFAGHLNTGLALAVVQRRLSARIGRGGWRHGTTTAETWRDLHAPAG